MSWLRTLMFLALVVWVGGIVFFAFVEAPTAFHVLPSSALAGSVVGPSLTKLHWTGIVCGLVFLLSSVAYNNLKHAQTRLLSGIHILIFLMLVLTCVSQFAITPRMRELRAGPLSMDTAAVQTEFDRLHHWSERLEGGVLLSGLVAVILTGRRNST
jgi:uncharacterized membrane protein YhhN